MEYLDRYRSIEMKQQQCIQSNLDQIFIDSIIYLITSAFEMVRLYVNCKLKFGVYKNRTMIKGRVYGGVTLKLKIQSFFH